MSKRRSATTPGSFPGCGLRLGGEENDVSGEINCDISSFVRSACVVCGAELPGTNGAGRPRTTCKGEGDKLSPCRAHLNNARRRVETFKKKLVAHLSAAYVLVTSPGEWYEGAIIGSDRASHSGELEEELSYLLRSLIGTNLVDLTDMDAVRASWMDSK
jgi:hypothetical protein